MIMEISSTIWIGGIIFNMEENIVCTVMVVGGFLFKKKRQLGVAFKCFDEH
jgi:hypothetical protein